jgi:hypothetical protein
VRKREKERARERERTAILSHLCRGNRNNNNFRIMSQDPNNYTPTFTNQHSNDDLNDKNPPVAEREKSWNGALLDYQLHEEDVYCGRGNQCYNHSGNQTFRKMIRQHLDRYIQAKTKYEKSALIDGSYKMFRHDVSRVEV